MADTATPDTGLLPRTYFKAPRVPLDLRALLIALVGYGVYRLGAYLLWLAFKPVDPVATFFREALSILDVQYIQGELGRFIGEVNGPAKRQLLWAADVLALPSLLLADGRTEGSPVVVWEALAAGCPVVASRVGGVPMQLDGAGLLVPAGDARSLATALERVLFDPIFAAALRERGQKRAQEADWLRIAPRVLGDRFATIDPRATSLR